MMESLRVIMGYDHRGMLIKDIVAQAINKASNVKELSEVKSSSTGKDGTYSINYPHPAELVARNVSNKQFDFGVLICGTGIGMSIVANKFKGCRAAHVNNLHDSEATRKHNNANILCLGSDHFSPVEDTSVLKSIVNVFLSTNFEGGRHQERVDMISEIEGKCSIEYVSDYLKSQI